MNEKEIIKLKSMKDHKFELHVFDNENHLLKHFKPNFSNHGQVSGYKLPATIEYDDCTFVVFSEYWTGVFPTNTLLKFTKVSTKLEIKEV